MANAHNAQRRAVELTGTGKQIEVDAEACLLDIMDTAGQEEYSALRDQYMKSGEGFLLVYSVTSKPSFEAVNKLRTAIIRSKEINDIPILLVGNKCDLEVMWHRCVMLCDVV